MSGLMHEQGGGKGTGKKSHIFDFPNGTAIWRKFAKLRTQLFPYIYTEAHTAHQVRVSFPESHSKARYKLFPRVSLPRNDVACVTIQTPPPHARTHTHTHMIHACVKPL